MKFLILALIAVSSTLTFAGGKEVERVTKRLPTVDSADVAKSATAVEVDKIQSNLKACLDQSENETTMGRANCAHEAHKKADDLLNATYQNIIAGLKSQIINKEEDAQEIMNRLKTAQRAWIAFRDANSKLAGVAFIGGSEENVIIANSLYEMTKERVLELDSTFFFSM